MEPAFVINLDKRPDRYARLTQALAPLEGLLHFTRVSATDGSTLDLGEPLRSRIDPWNFEHLPEPKLRGVVGCALSHLKVWETIAKLAVPRAFVFEDDASPLRPETLREELSALLCKLPVNFDLLWLNDWDRLWQNTPLQRLHFKLRKARRRFCTRFGSATPVPWRLGCEKTAEAYMLTPACAGRLHQAFSQRLGAIDHHMLCYFKDHPEESGYELHKALFTQYDHADTNIQWVMSHISHS